MKTTKKVLALLLAMVMCVASLAGCGVAMKDNNMLVQVTEEQMPNVMPALKAEQGGAAEPEIENLNADVTPAPQGEQGGAVEPEIENLNTDVAPHVARKMSDEPDGEYNEGVVLVKYEEETELTADMFGDVAVSSFAPLYRGSVWYKVLLETASETIAAVKSLATLDTFAAVDYDYIMNGDADIHSVDISANTESIDVSYLDAMGIRDAWDYFVVNEKHPGGSADVVVAVIDTGVDYNHLDLRKNIWKNSGEIPGNGIDDDGNGYIDDVYGWNCVGDNNDPMDDNGHGTHVAGIIAADNNAFGVVGVAYNCKVMCLKAGTSSGSFNNSDIAEAIRYAYMNGASVINMSFGGTSISLAVEEALEDAYNQCVLVAAAGNDGKCNQPGCPEHEPRMVEVMYPAALTYVIGVMSCDATGTTHSYFSNFDHYQYNTYEYDVYAPGEQIASTFPNNKYACLSGTSMACPNVAGIAALLRSEFSDRDQYSTKFITSQIVANGGKVINDYYVANAYNAINNIPKPNIYGIHDYYIFDDPKFSANNNGNGIIEAGEVIHLGFELMNRGGKATDVTVSVNTKRLGDDITDPYIHILSNDITYSEIGTYSIRDGGKVYDDNGKVIDVEHPIVIKIDEETPNDYLSVINFVVTYKNGLDSKDETVYSGDGSVTLTVTNGYILPEVISEDTVFEANRRYIVAHDVTISKGVTVEFKEGCDIQFYADSVDAPPRYSPRLIVYGAVKFSGSKERMIKIHPSENHYGFITHIYEVGENASISFVYTEIINYVSYVIGISGQQFPLATTFEHSVITYDKDEITYLKWYDNGVETSNRVFMGISSVKNSYVNLERGSGTYGFNVLGDCRNNIFEIGAESDVNIYLGKSYKVAHDTAAQIANNAFVFSNRPEYSSSTLKNLCFGNVNGHVVDPTTFNNNSFVMAYDAANTNCIPTTRFVNLESYNGNLFEGKLAENVSSVIEGYYDSTGTPIINVNDTANHDDSVIWPYVKNIEIFNKDGEAIRTVGSGKATVKVTFNRAMDTSKEFVLYYGSVAPYSDYAIHGNFADDGMSWTGEFQVKATIEGGRNFFSAGDACAADDSFKTLINNAPAFTFDIDATQAMSMNLQGVGTEDGIELTWVQDDYDTLMGYNVYRSDSKDGNFVRINPSVIPNGENTYLDTDAESGKLYWYTFTVVLSDMSESKPAGKVSCRSADTINPTVYHTPVNQGYAQNNFVISCTASDNIAIDNVKLYYRTTGETAWKTLTMAKQNDKYSATVFGSDVTLAGLEYYIVASDGRNEVAKGSAETPYTVVVKDASALSTYGDVDGDGVVTTKDALMLIQAINGDLLLTDDQFKRADLNKDGELSSMEALRILQYINGNVSTLSMN